MKYRGVPWVTLPLLFENLETNEIPTPKPYIFMYGTI